MKTVQPQSFQKDFVPVCHNAFFRRSEQFIQIQSSKSFSKSNQKKLKLISDSKSLQKKIQNFKQKRKIKPLKVKVAMKDQTEGKSKMFGSIKDFKAKISQQGQESTIKTSYNMTTLNTSTAEYTEGLMSKVPTQYSLSNSKFLGPVSNNTITSISNLSIDPFPTLNPTLNNSLVVNEASLNLESLVQTPQSSQHPTISTFQYSSPSISLMPSPQESPTHQYKTPQKIHCFEKMQKSLSTAANQSQQKERPHDLFKKQKLTLCMARKVETFETLKSQNDAKTQNDGSYSFVEDGNEYLNVFNNFAFPDYFSSKRINGNMLIIDKEDSQKL